MSRAAREARTAKGSKVPLLDEKDMDLRELRSRNRTIARSIAEIMQQVGYGFEPLRRSYVIFFWSYVTVDINCDQSGPKASEHCFTTTTITVFCFFIFPEII